MLKKIRVLISLEQSQLEWLETQKQRTGASRAAIVRKLIDRRRHKNKVNHIKHSSAL